MRYRLCTCGNKVEERFTSCTVCGADVGARPFVDKAASTCSTCGKLVAKGGVYFETCPHCGASLEVPERSLLDPSGPTHPLDSHEPKQKHQPAVEALHEAEKSTRHGATAGFISAAITLAMVLFAMAAGSSGDLGFWNDPWIILDVVLIAGLAVAIHRKSRAASVLMFAYFILSKIYLSVEMGRPAGIVVGLVFLYFFGKAIQGSFAYHRIRASQDPDYRPAGKWMYFVWPPIALTIIVLALYGLSSTLHLTPQTAVVSGEDLSQHEIDLLVSEGLLQPGERVVLFYSEGLLSIREGGNILTEERVISYEEVDGELWVASVSYSDIEDVVLELEGDFFNDAVIAVYTASDEVFRVLASAEEGGDSVFVQELRDRWQAARK